MNSLIYSNYIQSLGSRIATGNIASLTKTNQLKKRSSIVGSFTVNGDKTITPVQLVDEDQDISGLSAIIKVTQDGVQVIQLSITTGSNVWANAKQFTDTTLRTLPTFSYTDVSTGTTYTFNAAYLAEINAGSAIIKINYLDSTGADFNRIQTSDTFRVDFDYD